MALISPSIKAAYERRATRNKWVDKKEVWFDFRLGMDLKREDGTGEGRGKAGDWFHATVAQGTGASSIHRAHFLEELVALVPEGRASFGKHAESVAELEEGGRLRVQFSDGTSVDADAVVGTDGIKSRLRSILLGSESPAARAVYTGKYAYRGLIPMEAAVELLGEELARNSQMYFGYGGHVLTFPIEGGRTMNVVAFRSSKDKGKWEHGDKWVVAMDRAKMEQDFRDWGDSVKSILSLMQKPDLWALFEHPPAERYVKGRVALLGDAAHASTPHQGAGAGMALEDAYVLAGLLREVSGVEGVERAFEVYDQARRERSQRLVRTSRDAGKLYDLEDADAGDDLEKVRRNLDVRQRWIWDHDLTRDLVRAKESMRSVDKSSGKL